MTLRDTHPTWVFLLFFATAHCSSQDAANSSTSAGTSTGGATATAQSTTSTGTTASGAGTTASSVTTGMGGASAAGSTTTTTTTTTTISSTTQSTSTSTSGTTTTSGSPSTSGASGGSGGTTTTAGENTSQGTTTGGVAGGGNSPFKGVANSPCQARTDLGVSWYYNWMQYEDDPCDGDAGGEFVPMVWGHPGDEQSESGIQSAVASFVDSGFTHVLAFNEPDNPDQSNIPVATAISLLPAFDNPSIQIGSPATAANADPGQVWFDGFMTQLNADSNLRVDFLAIHWYGWNEGSCDASASQLENYINWVEGFAGDRPIWITEWGCLNQSAPSEQTVVDFYQGAVAMFENHPRIERYAWYPWSTNCHLNNDADGSLTALGEAFAAAPATR